MAYDKIIVLVAAIGVVFLIMNVNMRKNIGQENHGIGVPDGSKIEGYIFYLNKDSVGEDIKQIRGGKSTELTDACKSQSIAKLKAACDFDKHCKGFNTSGFLKKTIRPIGEWQDSYGPCAGAGLYVKID